MANTLYVFLHGTVCLIECADHYKGVLIEMDDHRVSAGNFLTERTIPKGESLELTGVPTDQNGTLDDAKNIVASIKRVDEIALHLFRFAEIKLPKPKNLHSLRTGTFQSGIQLAGSFLGAQPTGHYSVIQVFEYSVADLTKVQLAGPRFGKLTGTIPDFPAGRVPKDLFCSFHIFDEPETAPEDEHFIEEFNRGCRILGVDLRMTSPLKVPDLEKVLPGTFEEETIGLEKRVQPVVDRLARIPREGFFPVGDGHYCGTMHGRIK
jgi:hypothetical protein